MDKNVRGFHEATWEFFTTERSYVLLLKLAVDVYLAVLLDLQQKGILNEVDIDILLENIKEPIDHKFSALEPLEPFGRLFEGPGISGWWSNR